ncbi:unnamed protein product [Amaranthus hypochondriacus]
MPPRTKKSAATPAKKSSKTSKTPAKSEVKSNDDVVLSENNDNVNSNTSTDLSLELKSDVNGSFSLRKEDEVKEDEYEKDERLDLEDNEPEYEPEEYGGEYDEKEGDQDDLQEEGDEGMEEVEDGDLDEEEEEEEEGDVAEEDMEEVPEELEGEEEDEHADADEGQEHDHEPDHEHTEMFDAAEAHEHHELFKERRKRKEFEVFVGGLDKDATKEDLKEVFSAVGEVTEVRLMMNPQTKKNKGFAFLRFATVEQAKRAVTELKNPVVKGKQCGVTPSQDSDTLFLGNICKTWTKEKVKTVFIDGLLASWDEDRVRVLLKKFGEIEKVELARNMPSARRKDFGFVTFDSHDAAVTCAKSINNVELGEGDHKAKVRARLSRPLQRGKGKGHSRGDHKGARIIGRRPRAPWNRPLPRAFPPRARGLGSRIPAAAGRGLKRPIGIRDRRPPPPMPARARPLPPPSRSYERRAPAPPPSKSSLKRDYPRREELPPRSRPVADYSSRLPPERRPSYRDDYDARSPVYADAHRSSASRSTARRPYPDDSYAPRYERPLPSYREGRPRDYDSMSGSKRSYSAMDDVPSRYADPGQGVRHSRARLDYDIPSGSSQYGDSYGDRGGRSTVGYSGSSSRSSMSAQDSHGLYSSRQGMSYSGSYSGNDGVYSSSYGNEYASRGSDVGGSSYSSMYSGRGLGGGSSYMGGGSSGSYY